MKKSLIPFFIFFLLFSCKKNVTTVSVDKRQYFKNTSLTHFDNFRMYTKDGEVVNRGLAQAYADEFSLYFYKNTGAFTNPNFQNFVLVDNDSIVNISTNPIQAKRTSTDTYDKFSSKFTTIINDTNVLNLHIIKYKLLQQKTSAGFIYHEIEDPVYFLKKVNDTLFFPIVRYVMISRKDYVLSFYADTFNNVFSADGLNKLGRNDTLVVQSFDLAMTKIQ